MYQELERNIPGHAKWQGSFYERLEEDAVWDINAFWSLHLELIQMAEHSNSNFIVERKLVYALVFLQQRVSNLIAAHFDNSDTFNIVGLSNDQLVQFRERFDMAILGAVTGELVPESSFDLQSPLIKNA